VPRPFLRPVFNPNFASSTFFFIRTFRTLIYLIASPEYIRTTVPGLPLTHSQPPLAENGICTRDRIVAYHEVKEKEIEQDNVSSRGQQGTDGRPPGGVVWS